MRLLGDRPLLQYTIEAGLASRRLDRLLLSSDAEEMIALAQYLGCSAPFRRPDALAGDRSSMVDVVLHAVDWLARETGVEVRTVVLLQPTQPFRTGADIDAAITSFEKAGATTLFSVEEVAQHPCECVTTENGRVRWALELPSGASGRQAFPPFYYINGAIYVTSVAFLRERRAFQDEHTVCHVMPRTRGLDINDMYDFHVAQGLVGLAAAGEAVFDDPASGGVR
jgi:CMP-N,N'-diacetyllegionaminic acid synthase